MIRKQKFIELSYQQDKKQALFYLQSSVAKVVNQENEDELKAFRELALRLFPIKPKKLADALVTGGMVIDQPYDAGNNIN